MNTNAKPNIIHPYVALTTTPNLSFIHPMNILPNIPTNEYSDIIAACTDAPCNSSNAGGNCPNAPEFIIPLASIPTIINKKNNLVFDSFTDIRTPCFLVPCLALLAACFSAPYAFNPICSGDFLSTNNATGNATTSIIPAIIKYVCLHP